MGYKLNILQPNFELKLFLIDGLWYVPERSLYTLRTTGRTKWSRRPKGHMAEGSDLQGE
jgi:hypothetical protein